MKARKGKVAGKGSPGPFKFEAKLVRKDMFFGVDLPETVSKTIARRGFVPVVGSANGAPLRTSLSPSGGGRHHVLLNREVRAAAGIKPGERVVMVLRVDPEPPIDDIAEDLADALREHGVLGDFESLPRGRRNQYLRWMEDAVHEDTRAKRVARLLEIAEGEREKRIDRGG